MFVRSLLAGALAGLLLSSCATPPALRRALASPYKPVNVFLRQPTLPVSMRRVAVLPLARGSASSDLSPGAEMLEPLWLAELAKRNVFEVVAVSPEVLRTLTGERTWAAEDKLPRDFLARLSQATGCDGAMLAGLTTFQAYPPLRVGWKARLVDCSQAQTWWAIDEMFDGGSDSVAAAAEGYARADLNLPNPLLSDTGVLHSPRRFGQYTMCAIVATLPRR